jgi:alpha-mannosidase
MPSKPAALSADGVLRHFLLLGSFARTPSEHMWTPFIREESAAPTQNERAGGASWRKAQTLGPVFDFMRDAAFLSEHAQCCAYAHMYLHSPDEREASLLFGSDDGIAAWVNGERVFTFEGMRPCVIDENVAPIRLRAGWNRLLLKVTQFGGAWQFCTRLVSNARIPFSDVGYALDKPGIRPAARRRSAAAPLCLSLLPPEPKVVAQAKPGAALTFSATLFNMTQQPTKAAELVLHGARGARVAAQFGALGSMQSGTVSFSLPFDAWLGATETPLAFSTASGKRALSSRVTLAPDPIVAFLMLTARGLTGLSKTQKSMLAEVRADLSFGWDVVADRAEIVEGIRAFLAASREGDTAVVAKRLTELSESVVRASRGLKQTSVNLAGHAHIDMNWLWRWPETVQACQDTFRQALAFMREYPEFRMSQSQAAAYDAIEREDPVLFSGIQQAVKRGTWEITGGMWTEGDTNLSSGEALSRSFLLAQHYFRAKFKQQATIGWLPDNFGHTAQLPQMLRLAGIDSFYHMRCGPQAQLYWWEGLDGSQVLAKTGQGYNDAITPLVKHEPAQLPAESPHQLFVYGVGNHGGGPTRRDIESALAFGKNRLFPEVTMSTARRYFERVRPLAERVHVHRGELQYIFEGCYTSVSRVKQGNRELENALQAVEALAVCAAAQGLAYPAAELDQAWKILVFNQFHDILPGSAIHESNADSIANYRRGLDICRAVRLRSLRFLAERVGTPPARPNTVSLLVYNPLAFERSDLVVAELALTELSPSERPAGFVVKDASGKKLACQVVRTRRFDAATHYFLEFVAPKVPGLGSKVFTVEIEIGEKPIPVTHWSEPYPILPELEGPARGALSLVGNRIKTPHFELTFSPKDGTITSLKPRRGKKLGPELVGKRGANRLAMFLEAPNNMSAWNLSPRPEGPLDVEPVGPAKIAQQGPESISWVCSYRYAQSTFSLTTTLHADSPRIDCRLSVDWVERGFDPGKMPMLRVLHALATQPKKLTCDVPFGIVDRPTGREVPAQKWVHVSLGKSRKQAAGLALLNCGKYGHSVQHGALALTLLRSGFYPDVLPDVGRHEIVWSLLPHPGAPNFGELARSALSFNVPFETYQLRSGQKGANGTSSKKNGAPAGTAFVQSLTSSFLVTGVKRAEGSRALIVRGYDLSGKGGKVELAFAERPKRVTRVDLLEDPLHFEGPGARISIQQGHVSLWAKPWEIVTLRCES